MAIIQSSHPLGIIGGSGLYEIAGLKEMEELDLETPYGLPSGKIVTGLIDEMRLYFLPRHGTRHQYNPSKVNYRANIFALKSLGVEWCLSVSAVGSLSEEIQPGHIVLPNQIIDRTNGRARSFFDQELCAHVSFSEPFCPHFRKILRSAATELAKAHGSLCHPQGTYICIEGPAFSSRAESQLYRSWGAHVIGMTNLPEAYLAREAEMAYATIALVTDYDCWRDSGEEVDAAVIIKRLKQMTQLAQEVIKETARNLRNQEKSPLASNALKNALLGDPKSLSAEGLERLRPLVKKYT